METLELTLRLPEAWHEPLIAELERLGSYAFWEEGEVLRAYFEPTVDLPAVQDVLTAWLEARHLPVDFSVERIPEVNWNARWEASLEPVVVPPFVVRPSWKPVEVGAYIELVIDPKMSFGTGYHETTRLMLRLLPGYVHPGSRVLDVGTGTGILAIAAAKLGAGEVLAVDIDPWSAVNAPENVARNRVSVTFRQGSLEVVPEGSFDVVLANIHRRVLEEMLPRLAEKTAGTLMLSGLLVEEDRQPMLEAAARVGFQPVEEAEEGAWWAVALQR